MHFPKVAIIVLNYNAGAYLEQCLRSLEALEYQNKEILVLDSASVDGSFEAVQAEFPKAKYFPLGINAGFAGGINKGIRQALERGADFVWLFNPDATCDPRALAELMNVFVSDNSRKLLSPVIYTPDHKVWFSGGSIDWFRMRAIHQTALSSLTAYPTDYLTGCGLCIHRELLETIGALDERFFLYYEDAEYSLRARKAGQTPFVVPRAVMYHAEQSTENPRKSYFLVFSGLLFFALHTPWYLRPYIGGYFFLRRLWNTVQVWRGNATAVLVRQAYRDYLTQFQDGFQLYLRKLQ